MDGRAGICPLLHEWFERAFRDDFNQCRPPDSLHGLLSRRIENECWVAYYRRIVPIHIW